jgi:hypothetical protein
MTTYPYIKIPNSIESIRNVFPTKPVMPTKPVKPMIPEQKTTSNYWILFIAIIAFVFILVSVAEKGSGEGAFLIFLLPLFFYFTIYKASDRKLERKYEKEYSDYLEEKINYENNITIYDNKIIEYKDRLSKLFSDEGIFEFRLKTISEILSINDYKPKLVSRPIRKGVSERLFAKHLEDFFGNKILSGYEVGFFDRPYVPDFIYYDNRTNLLIDIEIDEPYTIDDNNYLPIHCIDEVNDNNRDDFFTNNGWIVIRFAEEQVIRYPKESCEVILDLIDAVMNFKDVDLTNIPHINRWNTSRANEFIKRNYRNTYL